MAVEALTAELTAVMGASRKAPLCSFQKANICPRERWLQSLRFLANFGARRFPKGNEGKRVSSGYNRRRRLATRSSGKQQAERTAVRTAPIVCPEESPLVRPQAHISCRGGLTRRLRRGRWGCRPEGVQYFLSKRKKVPKKASGTATTKTAHVASHCGQALRYACAWLRASWPSAISGASRPSASLGGGLRPAVALRAVLVLGSLRSPAGKKPFIAHF